MSVLRRLVGYAAVMFGATTVFGLLSLLASLLGMVTRSKEAYGDYMTYVLVYATAQGFFIFGASGAIQRFSAADPQNRICFASVALRLFLILLAATGVAAPFAHGFAGEELALGVLAIPWVVLWWWGRYLVRSSLDAKREAVLAGVVSLSTTLLQIALLTFTPFEHALIYGDFVAMVLGALAAIAFLPGLTGASLLAIWRARFPKELGRQAFRFGVPLWWAGQVSVVNASATGAVVRGKLGAAEMATNGALQTFWQFAYKPIELLNLAMLPGLVRAGDRREELYYDLLRLCLVAFPAIGLVVAGGMPVFFELVDQVSGMLRRTGGEPFSSKYAAVLPLLILLAPSMSMTAFVTVVGQYATAADRPRVGFYAQCASAAGALAAMFPLVSAYGLVGALLAGHVGSVFAAGAYVGCLWSTHRREVRTAALWLLGSLVLMVTGLAAIWSSRENAYGWLITVPVVVGYLAGMMAFGLLRVQDMKRAWRAFPRRQSP